MPQVAGVSYFQEMIMQVMGIAGKAGSGKNTVAGFLAAVLSSEGYCVAVDSFAAGVKARARAEPHNWDGNKDEAGRQLLQVIGSDGRLEDENFWIRELASRYMQPREAEDNPAFLIITDVRYENEAEFVRENGVLWILEGREGKLPVNAAAHESEQIAWRRYPEDVVLQNDRTLEELKGLVSGMVACGRHILAEVVGL